MIRGRQRCFQNVLDVNVYLLTDDVSSCLAAIHLYLVSHSISTVAERIRDARGCSALDGHRQIAAILETVPTNQRIDKIMMDESVSGATDTVDCPKQQNHRAPTTAIAREMRNTVWKDCSKEERCQAKLHQWAREGMIVLRCACDDCKSSSSPHETLSEKQRNHRYKICSVLSFEAAQGRYSEFDIRLPELLPYTSENPVKHIPEFLKKLGFVATRKLKAEGRKYPAGFRWDADAADRQIKGPKARPGDAGEEGRSEGAAAASGRARKRPRATKGLRGDDSTGLGAARCGFPGSVDGGRCAQPPPAAAGASSRLAAATGPCEEAEESFPRPEVTQVDCGARTAEAPWTAPGPFPRPYPPESPPPSPVPRGDGLEQCASGLWDPTPDGLGVECGCLAALSFPAGAPCWAPDSPGEAGGAAVAAEGWPSRLGSGGTGGSGTA